MTDETKDNLEELNPEIGHQITETELAQPVIQTTIGQLLRMRREEKGLNLKTISQQTKIHMGLLEHLENNDLAKLPSKTYVRGFVKSTAKILGINQEEALDVLESTYNRDHKKVKSSTPNIEMRSEAARNTLSSITATPLEAVRSVTASSSAFLAKAAVLILIVGVIGFNIKNLIDRSAEERLKLPQVLSTIHQKVKSPPRPVAPKVAPKPATEDLKVDPIHVNIIQDKKELNQKAELTINDLNLKNISLGEKQFTEDNSVTGEKLNEIFPTRYRVHPAKGVENVFINAVEGDSWITYKIDDKEIKKYVLRQGRTVFMRGTKIRLFLGNTKSVKVFYNNKLLNLNAKGSTKNLVFPEELKTKYMNPLFVFQKDGSVITSDEYIKANQPATPPSAPTAAPITAPLTSPGTFKKL
jgi:cytoskeleton protein RodZ